ncbi:MAG: hypothetical protein QGH11_01315 [Pirellulaceae bacterium]|nr:hypothetical protein [Pirellulaceae bacterium]
MSIYRATIVPIASLLMMLATMPVAGQQEKAAYEIGSRRELMLDDFLFDALEGKLSFRMHRPRLAEKVFEFDAPWEGNEKLGIRLSGYAAMIRDGDLFRMYYASYYGLRLEPADDGQQFTGYSESSDGIQWNRPLLDRIEFAGSRQNNILLNIKQKMGSHNFAPFIDQRPGVPAGQRYKAVAGNGAAYVHVSPDGLDWKKLSEEPILSGEEEAFDHYGAIRWGNNPGKERAILDSFNIAFWDPSQQHYAFYFRAYLPCLDRDGKKVTGIQRSVMRATSKDFIHWGNIEPIQFGEPRRRWKHELYTSMIRPYPRAPQLLIGTPLRTVPRRPFHGMSFGMSESALMYSRDGIHFSLLEEPLVPPGRDVRNWAKHGQMTAWGMLQTAEDELSIYIQQHDHQPTTHLRRATLRTDGFVSLHAGAYPGGEALTRPLVFEGNRLQINAATSAAGSIRVTILDARTNQPIEGYEQSMEFYGDQISHLVHWNKRNDIAALAGRPVRLKFTLHAADLYSLRFFTE